MCVQSLGREDPLRKEWQITPVFLPRESHGQRSLEGYNPWGCKELDMTEQLTHTHTHTHTLKPPLLLFLKSKDIAFES